MKTFKNLITAMLIFIILEGCKKNDPKPDYQVGTNENINSWILDSMRVFYYWNRTLPKNNNLSQEPLKFFSSIKNPADRFSQLINPSVPETSMATTGSRFGFDMVMVNRAGAVQTVVSLVVPWSASDQHGIVRGDVVTEINSVVPTAGNIASLVENSLKTGTIILKIQNKQDQVVINSAAILRRLAVYNSQVLKSGSKKAGYVFLNSFNENTIDEMKTVFNEFKQQQVNELILDMRYNPGGEVPVAAAVAAMIAPVNGNNIFVEFRGNVRLGSLKSSFFNELSKLPGNVTVNGLAASRLNINRVYILTGNHTASAAELLANCLRPYLTVLCIGDKTLGKDMASFSITDRRNPVQVTGWEIHPLVYKLYNAQGTGDYSAGLLPDTKINELDILPLLSFGAEDDPLVRTALNGIAGINIRMDVFSAGDNSDAAIFDTRTKVDELSGPLIIKKITHPSLH